MTSRNALDNESILDEFEVAAVKRSELFNLLILCFSLFLLFLLLFFVIDIEYFPPEKFYWDWTTVVVPAIPATGLVLFVRKLKIGYFFNLYFYILVTTVLLTGISKMALQGEFEDFSFENSYRGIAFLILSIAPVILLLFRSIRSDFKVGNKSFWINLGIAFIISITLTTFLVLTDEL